MHLSKKAILVVIIIGTIALLGLSVLQIQNLRSSLNTNKQLFLQKVDLASTEISSIFINSKMYQSALSGVANHTPQRSHDYDEVEQKIREIIDPILEEYGLDIPYIYAVYAHKEVGEGFVFVFGDDGASLDFELESCENPKERSHGWSNLTCKAGMGNLHLALFFPSQDSYVFAQSSGALILSAVFILLLISCFAYTLIVIKRQKQLSIIKNDFINNLTHEFKTPIASISLAASMMKSSRQEIDEQKKINYLNLIELESKRLEGQVDKILQIAMIDSGNFSLEKKAIDIHDVIRRVVESMMLTVNKRNGEIKLFLNATTSVVVADDTHMVNIIYNLIDNALKYTTGTPHISISTYNSPQGVEISIKDNGIGIGEEVQKYIFDKFYRVEAGDVRNTKGFGLGLSYVKRIIDEHGGRIGLTSRLDHGSEFLLHFPFG